MATSTNIAVTVFFAFTVLVIIGIVALLIRWCIKGKGATKRIIRSAISIIVATATAFCVYNFFDNIFCFDRSGITTSEGFILHGEEYVYVSGYYRLGPQIAMTESGDHIHEVKGSNRDFLLISDGDHYYLCAKKGVTIPSDGNITMVSISTINNVHDELLSAITEIENSFKTDYTYRNSKIWEHTDEKVMEPIHIYYQNSTVAVNSDNYIGTMNGQIVYAKRRDNTIPPEYNVYIIPRAQAEIIQKYL